MSIYMKRSCGGSVKNPVRDIAYNRDTAYNRDIAYNKDTAYNRDTASTATPINTRSAANARSTTVRSTAVKNTTNTKDAVTRRFLEGPKKMQERIENMEDSFENLNAMICSTTSHFSTASSGSRNVHAHEELIIKKTELEKRIKASKEKLEEMKAEVALAIMSLEEPNQQRAIFYRYLDGRTNEEAANLMRVEIRSVQRYVQAGCRAMRLPDRYYKKKESGKEDASKPVSIHTSAPVTAPVTAKGSADDKG